MREKKAKSSKVSKRQIQKRLQADERKRKELKEYEELEQLLSYSQSLYNRIESIQIRIASPSSIQNWGRRTALKPQQYTDNQWKKRIIIEQARRKEGDRKHLEKLYRRQDLSWIGEVRTSDTLHFKNNLPIVGGLFCPVIFGPVKNWECSCGKYQASRISIFSKSCKKCRTELADVRVRRYRMGFHYLNIPIPHFWYFSGRTNYFLLFMNLEAERSEEKIRTDEFLEVLYGKQGQDPSTLSDSNRFASYASPDEFVVLTEDEKSQMDYILKHVLQPGDLPSEQEAYNMAKRVVLAETRKGEAEKLKPRRGGEIIDAALREIDLQEWIRKLREKIFEYFQTLKSFSKYARRLKEIRICESFVATKTELVWMLFTILPILPPGLRNIYEDEAGMLITSDLNTFYIQIIQRNKALLGPREFLDIDDIAFQSLTGSHSLLQQAIDRLIDNARTQIPYSNNANTNLLKSLTESLEGKEGRFRWNLFGKRVNYSARSVIVVGPNLRLNQCSMPLKMVKTLFAPLLYRKVLQLQKEYQTSNPIYDPIVGINMLRLNRPKFLEVFMNLIQEYSILLNRAPTLHKFGIQAFEPLITYGQAIELHPLVCTGFNADFDGDQMGLYLPILQGNQVEITQYMKPSRNIFSPANGEPVVKPTQDMVIGANYLTQYLSNKHSICLKVFSTETQVVDRYYQKKLSIHAHVFVKYPLQKELFEIQNDELLFFTNFLLSFEKKVFVIKILSAKKKVYLFTNLGILLAREFSSNRYELESFFVQTTPGRILLKKYLQMSLND